MRRCKWICWICIVALLASCEQEEIPILPFDRGEIKTGEIEMGNDYRYQVFYDLETDSIVSTNLKTDWDIAVACDDQRIFINSAKFMSVWMTGIEEFSAVTDTAGFVASAKFDVSSGNPDSTAFGDLQLNIVYLIDRGRTEAGTPVGMIKMMITAMDDDHLEIRYANPDGTNEHAAAIYKEETYHTVAYSFSSHTQLSIEPPALTYDLLFTQYTYYFSEMDIAYLVTGVLSNSSHTAVAVDSLNEFNQITIEDTIGYLFSNAADRIGYNWKVYDFDAGQYIVDPTLNYIIRTSSGYYYKLHFVDFYDSFGNKGYPVFEFQLL